jgi:putative aldouronate transport system permease protein
MFGWLYSFVNYKAGFSLFSSRWVGLKYFAMPFSNFVLRDEFLRVMRNTLITSGYHLLGSPLPLFFAIFLSEIKFVRYRKSVQILTTVPNFVSWVIVYSVVHSLLSLDGFVNHFLQMLGLTADPINFMATSKGVWITQWGYGTWKGLGWASIMYMSAIAGIDQELYEAASIDGADRFQKMWHITVPGLLPTYFVMLLMAIANILSNGMDQYLVFSNARNKDLIEVLDLYVYNLGILNGIIPLSTVVGMVKSLVSVILLFSANRFSKAVRGESIV